MKKSMKKFVVASLLVAPFLFSSVNAEDYVLSAAEGKGIGKIKLEKGKNFGYWKGDGSGASWTVQVKKPGKATLTAMLGKPGAKPCGDLKALLNGKEIAIIPVKATGGWGKYKPFTFGEVNLPKGKHTVSVVIEKSKGGYFANMKELKLNSDTAKIKVVSAD